jgi:thiol-disulfide isomerase/thioredoxin
MKPRSLLVALALACAFLSSAFAQDAAPAPAAETSPAAADLKSVLDQIMTKLRAGQRSAADLAPEIAKFDALLAKYAGQKTDDVAEIALMKALLYVQVLEDEEKGHALLVDVRNNFAGTKPAAAVDSLLGQVEQAMKAKQAQANLVGNAAPEIKFTWSDKGTLTTLSALKGQVVVLDFWATWCGPCIASFPHVRELTAHYKDSPVTIIGVTSLQGRVHGLEAKPIDVRNDPAREMALMHDYIKAKDITWHVAFSEQNVFNPDYGVQGIPYVAIIAPDGTVRHAGLNPHDPSADIDGKVAALLKEFKLPAPKA